MFSLEPVSPGAALVWVWFGGAKDKDSSEKGAYTFGFTFESRRPPDLTDELIACLPAAY